MSFIETPNGEDSILKTEQTEASAADKKADQADKKETEQPKKKEAKEGLNEPKNQLELDVTKSIEKRLDTQNTRLASLQNQKENHEAARLALKEQAAKEDRLKNSDYAPDVITDVATAMQAPEGVTKPDKGPPGEDRQETQLAKGKEVDQKEVAKQAENPEAKANPETSPTQVASVDTKAAVQTEQNTQVADVSAVQKVESADAQGMGGNTAGGRVA